MRKYIIAAGVGGLLVAGVLGIQGYGDAASVAARYRILCDAFTVPGVALILTGILVWVAGEGLFDGVSYAARNILRSFTRWGHVRYYDYLREKKAKRHMGGYGFLFLTGGAFLSVAVVFFALFYSAY